MCKQEFGFYNSEFRVTMGHSGKSNRLNRGVWLEIIELVVISFYVIVETVGLKETAEKERSWHWRTTTLPEGMVHEKDDIKETLGPREL